MTAAIEIDAIHKQYGATQALRGVSFSIARGEFFGLLGPNGAGKSTLINILAGLTRATSGTARVAGHDVVREFARTRQALGVVPQELVFDPFFNVREVLRIQAGYFGLGAESYPWIDELIDALMLTDKAGANMRSLSGGMKRRVLVAQALVHKPEVVVLDEPTAGVDVELRKSLWAFIQRLHRDGHTIVLTTHYLEEAEQLCDRIAILNHGQLAALDSKPALLARGLGKVLAITTAVPFATVPEALRAKVKSHKGNTIEFDLDIARDSIGDILEALRAAGAVITDLHTQEPDLEDIFLQITHEEKS
jgi:ABC-2 type transport system ATP-binding protein